MSAAPDGAAIAEVRAAVQRTGEDLGRRLRLLVGKPGLDGHSNGAEQVAVRARDVGFEVVYQGIRLTPAQIVAAAVEEDVHCVGLSILSGSHMELIPDVLTRLRDAGAGDVPVIVGGIVPDGDARALKEAGVAAVFTPKDYGLTEIMARSSRSSAPRTASPAARPDVDRTWPMGLVRSTGACRSIPYLFAVVSWRNVSPRF